MSRLNPFKLGLTSRHLARISKSYLKLMLGRPSPLLVSWSTTYKCNLSCFFCDRQKEHHDKLVEDLSLNDAKKIVDDLVEANVMTLTITGGEPLVRKDLEEIAKYARDKGLIVTLSTNGTLITKSRANKLVRSFHCISVSLDGLSDTHDRIRGEKGTYDKVIQGIRNLVSNNASYCVVGVNLVLNKLNFREFPKVFNIVKDIGVGFFSIIPVRGSASWTVPKDAVNGVIEQILRMKLRYGNYILQSHCFINHMSQYMLTRATPKLCVAGRLYLTIDNEGSLFLCSILTRTRETYIGSLLQHSMVDLLRSERLRQVVDNVIPKCSGCLTPCTTDISFLAKSPLKTILDRYANFRF